MTISNRLAAEKPSTPSTPSAMAEPVVYEFRGDEGGEVARAIGSIMGALHANGAPKPGAVSPR